MPLSITINDDTDNEKEIMVDINEQITKTNKHLLTNEARCFI